MAENEKAQHELMKTYFGLVGFLALTVGLSFVELGPLGLAAALTIAAAKVFFIVAFFMHVRYRGSLVAVFAAAGFFWLLVMFVLLLSDYLTRWWHLIPE